MFSYKIIRRKKLSDDYYRHLAKQHEEKADAHIEAGRWLAGKSEYAKAHSIIAKKVKNPDDADYRSSARCSLKVNQYYLNVEPRHPITGVKEKALKGFLSTLTVLDWISGSLTRDDHRMIALCHELSANCYREHIHPERMSHAYLSFQALKKIHLRHYTQEDARKLIAQFNLLMKEFPTAEVDLSFADYRHVIAVITITNKWRSTDATFLANAYKQMGLAYIKKDQKRAALDCFLKMFDYLQQDKQLTLRTLELYFRSTRCVFTPGSPEHEIFSCATLIFSSPLKITEKDRLCVYQTIMCPLVEVAIKTTPTKACYKNLLQCLKMLRDYCKTDLFPEGAFKGGLQDGPLFYRLCAQIRTLKQGAMLRKNGFFDRPVLSEVACVERQDQSMRLLGTT